MKVRKDVFPKSKSGEYLGPMSPPIETNETQQRAILVNSAQKFQNRKQKKITSNDCIFYAASKQAKSYSLRIIYQKLLVITNFVQF